MIHYLLSTVLLDLDELKMNRVVTKIHVFRTKAKTDCRFQIKQYSSYCSVLNVLLFSRFA